ncbi:MAG: hypothetical protein J6I47_00035 [Ruminococcus sp.]|nr:hypothetical protein [Ruminococcus sp.]
MYDHAKRAVALILTLVCLTSCGKAGNSSSGHKWQNSDTLNEWQMDLLEAQGLPTDIEQLTPSQKRSIQHIYEMINYLNEKYDEEFVYAGYVEPGVMDEETLYAYPKQYGAEGGKNTVEVTLDDNGDFTDTYSDMGVSSYLEKLIGDYVRGYFKSDEIAYFMTVNASDIKSMDEVKNGDFQWKIGLMNSFFFSDKYFTQEDIEKFAPIFAKWLYEHKIVSDNHMNIVRNVDVKKATYSNNDACYKFENNVFFFDLGIDRKSVSTTTSINRDIKRYDTEEYVNKELD